MSGLAKFFLVAALFFASALPAFAVEPDEILDDPALEERARAISKNLRCLVCQNENIDSSHATLARDLRLLVRERLVAGDSDDEVVQFVVTRYGDFVLLKPPVQGNTLFLWLAPALFMVIGAFGLFMFLRRSGTNTRVKTAESGLSDQEQRQLADLLDASPKDQSDNGSKSGN